MKSTEREKTFWRGRFIRYAPLILWVAVIFINSSTVGASNNTSRIIRPLLEWVFPNALPATIDIYHSYIRKLAHFTEYAALAFLAARAFRLSSQTILRKYWAIWAFLVVFLIASTDEYNQSFNPLRTSSVYDVFIDIAGGAAMISLIAMVRVWRKNK